MVRRSSPACKMGWLDAHIEVAPDGTQKVAPITGAWVETLTRSSTLAVRAVAPITGAWVETTTSSASLLMACVAPLTGAWVETSYTSAAQVCTQIDHAQNWLHAANAAS
jgi:hypothetical protein